MEKMMILNLTQHPASADQIAAGVVDMTGPALAALKAALTFDAAPVGAEIKARAATIAEIASAAGGGDCASAMIGGAGYLMPALESALWARSIEPLHAFTRREVVESTGADGAVTKTAVFRHAGWVRTA
jgi:hypothetical protein